MKLPCKKINDVLIYLLKKSSWTKEQLANMKNVNANGYKLFLANTDGITFNTKSL
jgi:hypothetical protein